MRSLMTTSKKRAKRARETCSRCEATDKLLAQVIAEVEADERFHYKTALVEVNAPLALLQVELDTKHYLATRLLREIGELPVARKRAKAR